MPTASTSQRPESASRRRSSLTNGSSSPRRSSLTNGSATPRHSSVTESTISPRRSSLTGSKGLGGSNGNVIGKSRNLRRSSSSQEIQKDEKDSLGQESIKDMNQNNLPKKLSVRRISRRRSSTSGALLLSKDGFVSPRSNSDENSPTNGGRKSSNSSLPNSPRRKNSLVTSSAPQQQKSMSPRWVNAFAKIKKRNSSTSMHFLSPLERLGTEFKFPERSSNDFTYTNENFLDGSLLMTSQKSIRALEFENEKERKETEEINAELEKMEEERKHLEVLESAIIDWIGMLKNIHRLSKGVPLMRSIRLVCLQMHKVFVENGGIYGASLLALRRGNLPNVAKISNVMEEVRAKVEEGGQELSLVDGKFLEEVREILGRLQGTIAVTLSHYR